MSITPIPELERLLDEHAEAKREFDKPLPRDEMEFYKREDRLLAAVGNVQKAATLDTLRALVNVAETAEREPRCPFCAEERHMAGWPTQPHLADCPLAPLVKGATDE